MIEDDEVSIKKLFKSKNLAFLTANTRQAFTQLRQTFTKTTILSNDDLERHIWIRTDVSGYVIDGILNQLTSDFS